MKKNTAISKHFTKPAEYIHTTTGTIFQRGCIDKRRSSDFSIQTRLFTFRNLSLLITRPQTRLVLLMQENTVI